MDRPSWASTRDETAEALASWARERGLDFEVTGLLPPASTRLSRGFGRPAQRAKVIGGDGGKGFGSEDTRPGRFSENLCAGTLPGGLRGTLGHHAYLEDRGHADRSQTGAMGFTAVVAAVPESLRVTRYLVGDQPRDESLLDVDLVGDAPYGPLTHKADLTPSLSDRYVWELPIRESPADAAAAVTPELLEALSSAPAETRITIGGGWVVAELWHYRWEAAELDGLCRTAAAVAEAMRRAAAALPDLEPGAGLPDPPQTQLSGWLDQMAAQVEWPQPPPDVEVAARAYAEHAHENPYAKERRFRHGRAAFVLVFVFFVIPWAVIGFLVEGVIVGVAAGLAALALAVGLARLMGGRAHEQVSAAHASAWGFEAFVAGYARSRGLWLEDEQELRRRLTFPLRGGPQVSMRGELADGVEGRLVLWRDSSDPEVLSRLWNLALAPAPPGDTPEASERRWRVWRVGDWLLVGEPTDRKGRSLVALDDLRREAARLARSD